VTQPSTVSGKQLYALLPEVYRTRDNGQLAQYVDACGELLDLVRGTLDQRLADCFPDREGSGRVAQDWLLPYFAQLLDVRLVSPHTEGKRLEIANAVGWRQRKGTLSSVEGIAEAVGQLEVEVDEGWRRVALTPRVSVPLMPAGPLLVDTTVAGDHPIEAARRPGLPVVTPDIGRTARAVRSTAEDPRAKASRFGGETYFWRQTEVQGAPCFPGSFDDPSRRLVDMRSPSWRGGHYHPRRLLLFVPPPTGFFPFNQVILNWGVRDSRPDLFALAESADGSRVALSNPSFEPGAEVPRQVLSFRTSPPAFSASAVIEIRNLNFHETLRVERGRIVLRGVAARRLIVDSVGAEPVIDARNCLFDTVEAPDGLVRLEYCTVGSLSCRRLQASDCLFVDQLRVRARTEPGCVRYSRVPPAPSTSGSFSRTERENTTERPVFFDFPICGEGDPRSSQFGQPSYRVLHPAAPESICFGAEDGGEMGGHHERRYCLQGAAVLDKLDDFLPVGIEAVLIPDPRLLTPPPEEAAAS
jgi:hypothetical protein